MEHRVRVAFRNRPNARMGRGLVRPALHWRARLPDVPVEEAQQSPVELEPVGLHIEAVSLRRVIQRLHRPSTDFPARSRKSVVWGKSVYVRVDLGGSRLIQNKIVF